MLCYARMSFVLILAFGLGQTGLRAEDPKQIQYLVQLFLQEGDPRGRSELLSRPQVVLVPGQQARVSTGQKVRWHDMDIEINYIVQLTGTLTPEGKMKLKVVAEAASQEHSDDNDTRVRIDRAHFVREAELGESLRLMIVTTGNKKKWVDLTVTERK